MDSKTFNNQLCLNFSLPKVLQTKGVCDKMLDRWKRQQQFEAHANCKKFKRDNFMVFNGVQLY
jgi:hypothetical protein